MKEQLVRNLDKLEWKISNPTPGFFGKTLFLSKNKEHVYFRDSNSLMLIHMLDKKEKY
jgi:hypothetical protein